MPSGRDGRRPGGQPTRARPQTPWCPSGWGEEGRLAPGAPGESARGRKEGCVHKERRRRVESGLQAEGSWGGVPTKRSQRQPGGRREDRDGGAVIKGETTCKPGRIIAALPAHHLRHAESFNSRDAGAHPTSSKPFCPHARLVHRNGRRTRLLPIHHHALIADSLRVGTHAARLLLGRGRRCGRSVGGARQGWLERRVG